MTRTLVIHAHPRPGHSVVVRSMQQVFEADASCEIRSLYALYPDFDIDLNAEQRALAHADLVVWLAPVYWYSLPALLKYWLELVLAHGWAYGPDGEALRGKAAWWVASAGGAVNDYRAEGPHGRPFYDFVAPVEQTAVFCGMRWLPPFIEHGGQSHTAEQLALCSNRLASLFAMHKSELAGIPKAT